MTEGETKAPRIDVEKAARLLVRITVASLLSGPITLVVGLFLNMLFRDGHEFRQLTNLLLIPMFYAVFGTPVWGAIALVLCVLGWRPGLLRLGVTLLCWLFYAFFATMTV